MADRSVRPGVILLSVPLNFLTATATVLASFGVVPAESTATPKLAHVRCDGRAATIVGTRGDDKIRGTSGDDVILALAGSDRVDGRGGDDVLCGGDGSDTLLGGPGSDRLLGEGDGSYGDDPCQTEGGWAQQDVIGDMLVPGPGDDYVDGGYDPLQTSPSCWTRPDEVSFDDSPAGIRAHLGEPGGVGTVRVGPDHDIIQGERRLGLQGSRYDDRMIGGPGDETFFGNGGVDVISGGAGDDELSDGRGAWAQRESGKASGDRLDGGPGADLLRSARGEDVLTGGDGDDEVRTDLACSTVAGGPGHDEVYLSALSASNGAERLVFDAAAGTIAMLPSQPACGRFLELESYGFTYVPPLEFRGTDAAEELEVWPGTAGLTASMGGGDDVVTGSDEDDVIDAGDGHDTVDGRKGRDVCISAEESTSCDADYLPLPPPSCDGLPATIVSTGTSNQDLVGTPGDDVIVGSDHDDVIAGLGGNDVICGRAGDDAISGGAGDDRLFAGDDEEVPLPYDYPLTGSISPGPGNDVVDLGHGLGLDTLSYASSASGVSTHLAPPGETFTVIGEGTDTVIAHDALWFDGSDLADDITGSTGDDHIRAGGGDDRVDGGPGNDDVTDDGSGSSPPGNDVIVGGPGDDVLRSTAARDELDGGSGADVLTSESRQGVAVMLGGADDDSLSVKLNKSVANGHIDGGDDEDLLKVSTYHSSSFLVDAAAGVIRASGWGQQATISDFESYELEGPGSRRTPQLFRFIGTAVPEAVRMSRPNASVLRATMHGGDDVVRATYSDDVIDGGAGVDTVRASSGRDVCLSVERGRDCEVLSP